MPKITYALQHGVLKHISGVKRGLECNCICPACHSALIARKGKKMREHFAHYNSEECSIGYETSIHMLAKEVLSKEKCLSIPQLDMPCETYESGLIADQMQIRLDEVLLEKSIGDITPDIIVKAKGQSLLIEIYVTHKIDETKYLKIRELGISTLEIDLSKIHNEITYKELETILLSNNANKKWIYNKVQEQCREDLRLLSYKYKVEKHGLAVHVMGCPIHIRNWRGKAYANLIDDCFYCKYLFEIHDFEGFEGDNHIPFILCTGKSGVGKYAQYKEYKRVHR
jgi:hypothetical protein